MGFLIRVTGFRDDRHVEVVNSVAAGLLPHRRLPASEAKPQENLSDRSCRRIVRISASADIPTLGVSGPMGHFPPGREPTQPLHWDSAGRAGESNGSGNLRLR